MSVLAQGGVAGQEVAEAADRGERCLEFMGDGAQEGILGLVGPGQFGLTESEERFRRMSQESPRR